MAKSQISDVRERWQLERTISPEAGAKITALLFLEDSDEVVVGTSTGGISLWGLRAELPIRLGAHAGMAREFAATVQHVFSVGADGHLKKWDRRGGLTADIKCHEEQAHAVAVLPELNLVATAGRDAAVRIWDLKTLELKRELRYRANWINCLTFDHRHRRIVAGTEDGEIIAWSEYGAGEEKVIGRHPPWVWGLTSAPGTMLVSGSGDGTVGIWDPIRDRPIRILEGHRDRVSKVHISAYGDAIISGSLDKTARIWSEETGELLAILSGHTKSVESVAISTNGDIAFTGSSDGTVKTWKRTLRSRQPTHDLAAQRYANAKVVLVGESGAGKTSLGLRISNDVWSPTEATFGAWATHWRVSPDLDPTGTEREIWLWDFGGQADQRLVHQLYFDDTDVAIFVFDPQRDDALDRLKRWHQDIMNAAGQRQFNKILVAGRVDVGRSRFPQREIGKFVADLGFNGYFETSAKTGEGCRDLREYLVRIIEWDSLPDRTTEPLFRALQNEVLRLRDKGQVLIRLGDLTSIIQARMQLTSSALSVEDVRSAVRLLEGPGAVIELEFGGWVLLRPEFLNTYAQGVVGQLRATELGTIDEADLLAGAFGAEPFIGRLTDQAEERILLLALHHLLTQRSICVRQDTAKGPVLVFPSYFSSERPDSSETITPDLYFEFSANADAIFAAAVVAAHHSMVFEPVALWRHAAEFKTATNRRVGIALLSRNDGPAHLQLFSGPETPLAERVIFARFVNAQILARTSEVTRIRYFTCSTCNKRVEDVKFSEITLRGWLGQVATGSGSPSPNGPTCYCIKCGNRIALWDDLEKSLSDPAVHAEVDRLMMVVRTELDNESKERILVGEVMTAVYAAGHIAREVPPPDHGIDMEVEFKGPDGRGTGRRIFLQLKSGDSHMKKMTDGTRVFRIRKPHYAKVWTEQPGPTVLIHRQSDGNISWMEISEPLKHEIASGNDHPTSMIYTGESFGSETVRAWAKKWL